MGPELSLTSMRKCYFGVPLTFFLGLLLFSSPTLAERENRQSKSLVIVVFVDQLRFDQIQFYRDHFLPKEARGFRFLAENGVEHRRAFFDHFPTHTALGHAAVSTGALPDVHGVVGNSWVKPGDRRATDSGQDAEYPLVGPAKDEGIGFSPRVLTAPTLGETLKHATGGKAKVAAVSVKDRGAVLTAGPAGDMAIWFNLETGNWVSSRYYAPDGQLPDYLVRHNREHHPDNDFDTVWTPTYYQPSEAPADLRASELLSGRVDGFYGIEGGFPHTLKGQAQRPGPAFYTLWSHTPKALTASVDLALETLDYYQMGKGAGPDLLYLSLSSLDKVGHAFGPNSPEAFEVLMATDREVDRFLRGVESRVGLEKCLVVLTSDHGVLPLPEHLKEMGGDAERLDTRDFVLRLRQRMEGDFPGQDWEILFSDPYIYLFSDSISAAERSRMLESLQEQARRFPGVLEVLSKSDLLQGKYRAGTYADKVARSTHRSRGGDLAVIPEPHRIFAFNTVVGGTHHGTPWTYDSHVPLLFYGWPGAQGTEDRWCTPRQVVSTIAHFFGFIAPGGCDVEPLPWTLETVRRTPPVEELKR